MQTNAVVYIPTQRRQLDVTDQHVLREGNPSLIAHVSPKLMRNASSEEQMRSAKVELFAVSTGNQMVDQFEPRYFHAAFAFI